MKHNIELDIATAKSSHAFKWRNKKSTWADIAESLRETTRTEETLRQYAAYGKDRQDEIKDVGGFVGGYLLGGTIRNKRSDVDEEIAPPFGIRRKGHIKHRQIVALDADHSDGLDTWLSFRLMEYAGLVYSTHKHTAKTPRYRIVFPLSRPVTPDQYEAIARTVASWLGIDAFDDTTYQPTRLMYYPSTSKDGEYLYDIVDAPIMDVDTVLAEIDETDPTTWPVSSREKAIQPHKGSTVEDPQGKAGVIGAFCRAFTIDEAIAEFLDEVYTPCEELGPDRYSYISGSTAGGLVVYNGTVAYSHHATDPAGGKLSNAFDLVRLHKFGELDERVKPGTDIAKLPSYKAMSEFAGQIGAVKKEIIAMRRETTANDYDDIEDHARKVGTADDWVSELETEGRKGTVKNTIANVVLILNNDENLAACFGYNEFEARDTAIKALPWDKLTSKYPRPLNDADDSELRLYMERCYGITSKSNIEDGLKVIIRANAYHPVENYLDAVTWDKVDRLDTLFIKLFGAPDTPYTRAVTRKAFTAAVARIYREGCKFDYVTVIIGKQGQYKSTTLSLMGGDWFSDSVTSLVGRDALESLQGAWIIELGELAGLRKAEVDAVKHFVSKTEDRYRVAYGKRIEHFPRRCVFFGTGNEEDFLRDVTGNRRFWVINTNDGLSTLNAVEYLTPGVVSLLWGEAKFRYTQGEPLYLDKDLEEIARDVQDSHLEKDDRSGLVSEYLNRLLPTKWDSMDPYQRRQWLEEDKNVGTVRRQSVCLLEIWSECLGFAAQSIQRKDSLDLSRIMKSLRDWQPEGTRRFKYYGMQKQFVNQTNSRLHCKPWIN